MNAAAPAETIDLYAILEVPRDADTATIKAAFKAKAKNLHPDVGGDMLAFDMARLARDVLTTKQWREIYDTTGIIPADQANNAGAFLLQTLTGLFGQVMHAVLSDKKDPTGGDFVAAMCQGIKQNIDGQNQQIIAIVHSKIHLGRMAGRFIMTNLEEANYMEIVVDGQMKQLDAQIEASRKAIAMQESALKYLEQVMFSSGYRPE